MQKLNYLVKLSVINIICSVIFCTSIAQTTPNVADYTKIIDVLPPSPNAASIGKYGGLDLSLASGMANVNIPIFNYTSNNLSLPISIAYSSSGFKVDELPGRVGVGWSINAGGVVTRTVMGAVDELSQRLSLPSDYPARSYNWINFMENASNLSAYAPFDAQPDIFSFNFAGYSGKFILDNALNPILLTYSGVKIEKDFTSTSWTFRFTSTDGVQYLFGGNGGTETSSTIQTGCGKGYPNFAPTAWYLTKIIHPNNDVVTLTYIPLTINYKTGISETIYSLVTGQGLNTCVGSPNVSPPPLTNQTCVSTLRTNSLLLDEINSTGGTKIKFSYIARSDFDDKLISKIDIYASGSATLFKTFTLNYTNSYATLLRNSYSTSDVGLNYRPFLTAFSENSFDGVHSKNYSFAYNSISSLPPRLSFAQDIYGYFNGAGNSTLIPHPTDPSWQSQLPSATANRAINPTYCQMGLLNKITYPTSGTDDISYESNQTYQYIITYPAQTYSSVTATHSGVGTPTTVYSPTAAISYTQSQRFIGSCGFSGIPGQEDAIHDKSTFYLIDVNTNTTIYTRTLLTGQSFDLYVSLVAGHSYNIKVVASGTVSSYAIFYYQPGLPTYQYMNVNAGGVRVKQIISSDVLTNIPNIKKYIYGSLSNQAISSAGSIYTPLFEKILLVYSPCSGGLPSCTVINWSYLSMYSNTQNNLYAYGGSPVSYSSVIESHGANFENGGIEHQFTVYGDAMSSDVQGDGIMQAPTTSFAWRNAREIYTHLFKVQSGSYIPVKKTFFHFKEDSRIDNEYKAYVVNKKYLAPCQNGGSIPYPEELDAYDVTTYSHFRKWVYTDSVRTWTYDDNGQTYVEDLNITDYGNVSHALPTKQTSYSSNAVSNVVTNFYPEDITLTGTEETARQTMIARHMTGSLIQQQVNKGTTQNFLLKTGYFSYSNGLVLPQTRNTKLLTNTQEERLRFYNYNSYGKILDQSKTLDARQSYVWDNLSNYPIAQVVNAAYNEMAYSSFETDARGNWTFAGVPVTDPSPPTGKMCYALGSGAITATGLTSSKSYIVSYWSKSGVAIVNAVAGVSGLNINGWTYYEHKIPAGATTVTVSGSVTIDELRLYPSDAQMMTNTYFPLIGVSSQCDANNKISYYEYDGLGRLTIIRDQDRNILKKYCYNYQGQVETCGFGTAAIWSNTTTAIRCKKDASNQNTGEQEQEQKDFNPASSTFNQLRWIVVGTNLTSCPLASTVYAKIVLTDVYNDVDYSSATVWIYFYSDAACTIPVTVNNLTVNYQKVTQPCTGTATTLNYSTVCTGSTKSLGSQIIARHDGIHCDNTTYSTTTGTGYVPK